MLISEIFGSISGESVHAGYLTTFIRTFGCNLRCRWCDSMYAVSDGVAKKMTVPEIVEQVEQIGYRNVILTGGEPLLQGDAIDLIQTLLDRGYLVEVETNGATDVSKIPTRAIITMDWKCPSSGMTSKMLHNNLGILLPKDVIKFVVGSIEDLDEMQRILPKTRAQAFVSPVFGKIELPTIIEYLKKYDLQTVRFQLQIHKFVWPVDARGV